MITLVVPIYNQISVTDKFLYFVSLNTVLPKKIILIDDNSSENINSLVEKYNKLPIEYIRHDKNEGVNYSWNEGIKLSKTPYLCIANNDIIVNKYFFKKVIETFKLNDKFGIVCGQTIKRSKNIKLTDDSSPITQIMKRREGWCFSIKKELMDKIPPIPKNLCIFCGDDFLFFWCNLLKYVSVKILNNYLFHYGSMTSSPLRTNNIRTCEKKLWLEYKTKILREKKNEK
jgi:GT2 family glycosyltransferase